MWIQSRLFWSGDLGRFVYEQLGLKVNLCEEPESTVIMGLGAIIENPDLAKLTL